MGWIEGLRGATVGLATAPLIYFIDGSPAHLANLQPFFEAAERREFGLVTSFVTRIEVLVHPLRLGRFDLADRYREILLRSSSLTAVPLSEEIAERAAELRARYALRTPDAIQLATAVSSGAGWFLTNDSELAKGDEIPVLVLKQLQQ